MFEKKIHEIQPNMGDYQFQFQLKEGNYFKCNTNGTKCNDSKNLIKG